MNIETSLKSDILERFISGSGYFYAPGKYILYKFLWLIKTLCEDVIRGEDVTRCRGI